MRARLLVPAVIATLFVAGPANASLAGALWDPAASTIAQYDLNGDLLDASGNGRHAAATHVAPSFVATACGMGVSLPGHTNQGFDMNAHAGLLTHPFSVEIVVTTTNLFTGTAWKRIFGESLLSDQGWYYHNDNFQAYDDTAMGVGLVNGRHYWTFTSTSTKHMNVYLDGSLKGSTTLRFTAPPVGAYFFNDDNVIDGEDVAGTVEALRVSSGTITTTQMASTLARLDAGCPGDSPPVPVPELGTMSLLVAGMAALGAVALLQRRRDA